MAGILDRLNKELEIFGRKAQAALDEGKLQLERLRLRREQDEAARQLGRLYHNRERGGQVDPLELDAYLVKLDNVAASIARVEREIAAAKGEDVSVSESGV
jgi:outer membrane protein TolC